jgi:hypothetical protein
MLLSLYSVYCLCVNVYCSTATGCQPNCSFIYIYIIVQFCVMCVAQNKQRVFPCRVLSDWSFVTQTGCLYWAIPLNFLKIIWINFKIKLESRF